MFEFLNKTAAKTKAADAIAKELHQENQNYRKGEAQITDAQYDQSIEVLRQLDPEHPYLHLVESEVLSDNTIKHSTPMLSTNKAYTEEEIQDWISKVRKAAYEAGVIPTVKAMAKLDGVACKRFSDNTLATRGDGTVGNVVSSLLDAGLTIVGEPVGECVGELVMPKEYFNEHLKGKYANPRNFVAGAVNADKLNPYAEAALRNGGIHFVLFKDMPSMTLSMDEFTTNHLEIEEQLREQCPYPIDGVVYEINELEIREILGSTSHHHNWQVAKKQMATGEIATVSEVTWTVGRTGVIFPTVLLQDPVSLSDTMVSRASGKHAGYILSRKIGANALIKLAKSGEIIPDIKEVIEPSTKVVVPTNCPCCQTLAVMREDQLYCVNDQCSEKLESLIIHHFKTIKALFFGRKTVSKLVAGGFDSIVKVYEMSLEDYQSCGLGDGEAAKLINSIAKVKDADMPDYLLTASLGISNFGRGSSQKILAHYSINELKALNAEHFLAIEAFGDITSNAITEQLKQSETLDYLLNYGFRIVHTKDELAKRDAIVASSDSDLAGMRVVFTGTCTLSRDEMNQYAQSLGCIPQKSVNNDTNYLVCGLNVGATKMAAAEKKGAKVITEDEFRAMA